MPGMLTQNFTRFFKIRDELSLHNLRGALWPLLLIFPLSVIMGDQRYFDLKMAVAGFESYELMLYPLGLGWLFLLCIPRHLIIPCLRTAAVISAALIPFQILIPPGTGQLIFFLAFQFLNGICAACAFSVFCFELNNVERLFGMALIQAYYGFYYTVWRAFPAVQAFGKSWGSVVLMVVYLVVVFSCSKNRHKLLLETTESGKDSAVPFVLGLDIVYYIIMCSINYIEWAESSISSSAFGIGSFVSIVMIIIIQLFFNRSALYIWLMFLVLSLLGLGALMYDSRLTLFSGSFIYGLGDGLGYIIIYYICAAAIKRSKSLKMFRLFCLVFFIQYCIISGVYSILFKNIDMPNKALAFSVVLVLVSFCFLLIPLLQKKLFDADWTDGLYLKDVTEYKSRLSEVQAIDTKEVLGLTSREQEMFTLLLSGVSPKEIGYNLKISYNTVIFHMKNLYRKLGIQSRAELFSKYRK